ncbi:recombination protein RecF [Bifidobacterium saguini DSM 23967]|uniref:DNA replication and repair protein RecF n=2 Tax=Bifidobacterium saguini TaxID=762210 RepID=A0A087D885_9BIFI|nr:DNA replication and repair protein RecF [Bifidobacterium saguini]KFI91735.1 recombination protein RecF [Bifidobacterium saguini DSM 23967]QTB89950.1 DNA replication and repair protein RecF [Bifidobacterium saguini]
MYVSRLALDHYRSWSQVVVDFVPGVNLIVGKNGLGKTNLVEAVEILSTGASHRTSSTLPLIERGQSTATIRANVVGAESADGTDQVTTYEASIHARGANRARINSGSSLYLRDIVGQIPSVAFTPEDQRLVSGDPAARRTLLNQAGALLERGYPEALQQFTRIAKQRATLLKQLNASSNTGQPVDAVLSGLEIWTGQFIEAGIALTRMRKRIIDLLAEPFAAIYRELAGETEQVTLSYVPSFDEVLLFDEPHNAISEHFQRIYPGEVARGVNLIGPQRDDLSLELFDIPAKEFASNGEMWTMALALKMALFQVIREQLGMRPIVILDDVFAQLDDSRRSQILDFAAQQEQVLITVASEGDVPESAHTMLGEKAHVIDVAALKDAFKDPFADLVQQVRA